MRAKSLVFADQASSSAGNFLLVAGAAHAMPLPQFGRFSLAYAAMQFGLEMSRALVAEPAQLLEATHEADSGFAAMRVARQSAVVAIGIGCVVALAVVAADLGASEGLLLVVSLPALAWFEGLRHRSLVAHHEARAAIGNIVWLGFVVAIIAVPNLADIAFDSAGSAIAAWALAALVASATFAGLSTGSAGAPLADLCRRGRRFATETLADRGLIFVGLGVGSGIIGSSEFGQVAAGRAVYAATNVAASALLLILITQFIRERSNPVTPAPQFWTSSVGLRLAVAGLPIALLILDETSGNAIARLLLGEREPPTLFLVSAAIFFSGVAASSAPRAWIRAAGHDVHAVRLRATNGALVAGSAVAGAVSANGAGMAVGLAVGSVLGAACWHMGATRLPA